MRRPLICTLLALLILPAWLIPVAGATPEQDKPRETGMVEKVEVQLFQLNFLATDKRGRPVLDLKPEEIEVLDHGSRQKIAFLEPYYRATGPKLPEAAETGIRREIPPPPEAPGASVVPDQAESPGRWMILVFDNYIANQLTKLKALEAARKFVIDTVQPTDHVAIISFFGRFDLVQPFTTDTDKLLDALDVVAGQLDRATTDRHAAMDDLLELLELCEDDQYAPWRCARTHIGAYEDERRREADAFMTMLLHVVRSVAPIPDVKTLVLFSNGFTRTPSADALDAVRFVLGYETADRVIVGQDFRLNQQYDELAQAAAEAKVSIFTINPGGAMGNPMISAERHGFYDESTRTITIDVYRNVDRNNQHALEDLARRTGGKSSQSADVEKALRSVMDISQGLYTVGYYPNRSVPSRTHDVKIKIRRRGVRAIARKEIPSFERRAPLTGELLVTPNECHQDGRRLVNLMFRLDVDNLTFEEVQKKFTNNFSIYLMISADSGLEVLHQDYRFYNITYEPERYTEGDLPDPMFEQKLVVPCKPLVFKAIATDTASGAKVELVEELPGESVNGDQS